MAAKKPAAKKPVARSFGSIGGKLPPFDPKEFAKIPGRAKVMRPAAPKPAPKPAAKPKPKVDGLRTRRRKANALAERGLDAL